MVPGCGAANQTAGSLRDDMRIAVARHLSHSCLLQSCALEVVVRSDEHLMPDAAARRDDPRGARTVAECVQLPEKRCGFGFVAEGSNQYRILMRGPPRRLRIGRANRRRLTMVRSRL